MMNERIIALTKECGLCDEDGDFYGAKPQNYEQFAELIVRECCGAANEWYQKHNELHWDPAQHIRNHFGVAE
jgi:hypothetical protein